jgi:TetR/AcrR family transcriptional repressor of lmrAB and yxaGH operons
MARAVAARADLLPVLAETFREHGYEGASLSRISQATGLGKGSLYHFFPGGKAEMVEAVLAEIEGWFATHVFEPLREAGDPEAAVEAMFETVTEYFRSGIQSAPRRHAPRISSAASRGRSYWPAPSTDRRPSIASC